MKHRFSFLRALACALALVLLTASLAACGASTDPAEPDETTVIGFVDGREVYYDELYFLVNRYMESAKEAFGDNKEALGGELDRLFRENVRSSYAILALCEEHGLTFREKDWKNQVDEAIMTYLADYFENDDELLAEELEEIGLSERYFRYLLATELLYGQLLYVYPEQGLVNTDESALLKTINEEFIHVYHLAIFNDEGDDKEANLAKMREARQRLAAGETMYHLIKNGYSEDFSDVSASGEYITKGTMDASYEKAAFSLAIGQTSDIVEATGVNNQDQTVSCYYIIQRDAMDASYVEEHYNELVNEYYGSVVAADLAQVEEGLSFEPNELYEALDLTDLTKPQQASRTWVIVLITVCATLAVGTAVAVILVIKRKHAKKNINYASKRKALTEGKRHERS